ncbi:DedA family protein [Nocardiopsis composta]|uniref:Membrane protein DedA with SNARE-associated domain n=1 Tax=Nocardiopsis composta TaxID=157465 RepID=A0A7W8QLD5_9ACTN|nr:VTT domain-containing protein [Nocardiopsis composta]MBB5432592.1 membrane protein DedA with SNARE-associated domain [Nocardiopsis composta]
MEYQFLEGQPFWIVYSALFGIVFARTQATYWIGRGLGAGVHRSRWGSRLGARLERAERLIDRFGPPVVTVAYVTVGVQTAIHLVAGAMRMSFPRYLAAMIPGCAIWAAIYSLGGLAVIAVWWNVFLRSPALAAVLALLLAAGAATAIALARRRRARAARPGEAEPSEPVAG